MLVLLAVGVTVGLSVGVLVGESVAVAVGLVTVDVGVTVSVGAVDGVAVGVVLASGVAVDVAVGIAVLLGVGVGFLPATDVDVTVAVATPVGFDVGEDVGEALRACPGGSAGPLLAFGATRAVAVGVTVDAALARGTVATVLPTAVGRAVGADRTVAARTGGVALTVGTFTGAAGVARCEEVLGD